MEEISEAPMAPEQAAGGETPPPIPVVTSIVGAPTVFADAVWFASNMSDVVRIQLLENVLEPQNSIAPGLKSRHVGTLVMPYVGFENLVDYLTHMRDIFRDLREPESPDHVE